MSAMNSLLTSSVINRGLDCQSIGSVMNSVLTSSVINRGLDCQSIGSVMNTVLTSSIGNLTNDLSHSMSARYSLHYQ
jgi:hypothetical protein